MDAAPPTYPPLEERPIKNTIVLFDVDGTLSPARRTASPEMLATLAALRQKVAIGYVGGSDLSKQQEQLGSADRPVTSMFDFSFSENGLTAWKLGQSLPSSSFIGWIGEDRYKELVAFILHYVADLDIPVKRGTFVEFRNGMINVSPIGRNASLEERLAFEKYDLQHGIRPTFIEKLKEKFSHLDLTYSIGGQLSFDVFPTGWDKTYCLRHLEDEAKKPGGIEYKTIHFFGDKTFEGGNDWEIYTDPRVTGHSVKDPDDTSRILKELFDV
ncbi:putative eukaryotic phosphomannomutase [Rosellinia necatrix]|uniref:Phosphomannomutase n=1 Tax=Rosellinia necatrix TaxID=77044 RepID=A0A1W2TTX8_ROSNE|nr:putative eukaryotic phosphomannomutase [Rosellinia necatrix]